MSAEDVETVRRLFETVSQEDIDAILEFTHPDFEVRIPPALSAEPDTYRGRDGMRRYWTSFRDTMTDIRFQADEVTDTGDGVLVAMRMTAKGRHTSIPVEQRLAALWTIRDRKVRRIEVYLSMEEAMADHGIAEARAPAARSAAARPGRAHPRRRV